MQLAIHAEAARPAGLRHAIEVVLRVERLAQARFVTPQAVEHVPQRDLAGKALLARRELLAQGEPLIGLHDLRVDAETSQRGGKQLAAGTAHLRHQHRLVGHAEFADLVSQRVEPGRRLDPRRRPGTPRVAPMAARAMLIPNDVGECFQPGDHPGYCGVLVELEDQVGLGLHDVAVEVLHKGVRATAEVGEVDTVGTGVLLDQLGRAQDARAEAPVHVGEVAQVHAGRIQQVLGDRLDPQLRQALAQMEIEPLIVQVVGPAAHHHP